MSKRGISPVIATVLLVSLTLILASIIFLWARAFIPETILKGDYGRIEEACKQVNFEASAQGSIITIQNIGNVPIQGIKVGIKSAFGSEFIDELPQQTVAASTGAKTWDVGRTISGEIIIIPILLSKTEKGDLRAFECGDESAKTINV